MSSNRNSSGDSSNKSTDGKSVSEILITLSDAMVSVAEKVSSSVVGVQTGRGMVSGTGVIWDNEGYIVTCHHVVKGMDRVLISSQNLGTVPAEVIGSDPYSDIAVLKISDMASIPNGKEKLQPIAIFETDKKENQEEDLKAGQIVLALANPFGEQTSITQGIITSSRSSVRGWWGRHMMNNVVITDARLNPGYSGGPLVDVKGKMIGLNAFYMSSRGIAIRASKVSKIVQSLKSHGRIKRAYLGISSYPIPIPKEVSKQMGTTTTTTTIDQDYGLMVAAVEPDSPAKKAGLFMGDVILSLNEKTIQNLQDVDQLLTQEIIGKDVKLVILRAERISELTITPSEAPEKNRC